MDDDQLRRLAEAARRRDAPPVPVFRRQPAGVCNLPIVAPPPDPARNWAALPDVLLDPAHLARNGLFPRPSTEATVAAFDILRTRTVLAMQEHGWRRIAVTSPTAGCGKSLVAVNLALSFACLPGTRNLLIDLDLRRPALARAFGISAGPLAAMLTGAEGYGRHLRRSGPTLALALNGTPVEEPGALVQTAAFAGALDRVADDLAPDAMILDLPPLLITDEVIGLIPRVDAVILVADATRSTAPEVLACERLFEGKVPLLGVVLNRAQDLALLRGRR